MKTIGSVVGSLVLASVIVLAAVAPASAEVVVVTFQCPHNGQYNPFIMDNGGTCQAPLGLLNPGDARAVNFLLPRPDCFASGKSEMRIADGNDYTSTTPPGAWIARSGLWRGVFSVYVKNDGDVVIQDAYAGIEWICGM
jgi:hypothetical protein